MCFVNREVYTIRKTSVQLSHLVMSDSLRPHRLQHIRPPGPPPAPGVYSNSCPLSWWWHIYILLHLNITLQKHFSPDFSTLPSNSSKFIVCVCVLVTQSCPTLCDPMDLQPARLFCPWNFPGKDTGVGCHFLLQGIFQPRDQTWVSSIAGRCFTVWATSLYVTRECVFLYPMWFNSKEKKDNLFPTIQSLFWLKDELFVFIIMFVLLHRNFMFKIESCL